MSNIIDISSYSFKFKDIPFIEYPVHIKTKNRSKYFNLKAALTKNECHSRTYQLNHRSTQAYLFDKLIELNYFKLLNIPYEIYKEVPIINTNLDNDPNRSYYLLDYFIPDLSLCIELDSDYHNPDMDKLKDNFLNSIGIKVYRVDDFNIGTKDKMSNLIKFIKSVSINKFNLDYKCIDIHNEYEDFRKNREYERVLNAIKSSNKFELEYSEKIDFLYNELCKIKISPKKAVQYSKLSVIDYNIFLSIIYNTPYSFNINLDQLYSILPMNRKQSYSYRRIVDSLKNNHNITMTIVK